MIAARAGCTGRVGCCTGNAELYTYKRERAVLLLCAGGVVAMLLKCYRCRFAIMRSYGFSDMHGQVARGLAVARAEQIFAPQANMGNVTYQKTHDRLCDLRINTRQNAVGQIRPGNIMVT